jgi:TonB-dependent starch-binding outer membrane protein SusC
MSNFAHRLTDRATTLTLSSLAVVASFLAPPRALHAQDGAVLQGVVTDQITGGLLDSATVTLVGTGIRTRTSSGGIFLIPEVPLGLVTIRTEAPGYPAMVEQLSIEPGIILLQIALLSRLAILEGILVTGKRTAPAPGTAADPRTAADLLMHQVPGVYLKRGVVGQNDSQILLRGVNSINLSSEPILFIDGVRMAGGLGRAMDALSHIPAAEVKEIRVLRGVAAAFIEGSANGVIYVQTRSGPKPR